MAFDAIIRMSYHIGNNTRMVLWRGGGLYLEQTRTSTLTHIRVPYLLRRQTCASWGLPTRAPPVFYGAENINDIPEGGKQATTPLIAPT